MGLIPGPGRSSGEGNGNLLQYSCLGNPMDRGTWRAAVHGAAKESNMTEWLNKYEVLSWNYLDLVYICLIYFCTNDSFNSTSLFPFSKPVCSVYKPVIYSLLVLPCETYKATSIMYSPQYPSVSGSSCPGTYPLLPLSPGMKHLASFPGIGSFPLPSSGIYKEGK